MSTAKTHEFQASVSEVLRLVVHSLYTNREIFLRELISNASDAIDKRRFRAIAEPALLPEGVVPTIRLVPDEASKTLTVSDDGVGMTEAELVQFLGTIAHSGTAELQKQLEAAKAGDVSLIGRFGVGFYAAFLVADEVEVVSRSVTETTATRWRSRGEGGFTTEPAERATPGTDIVLHLKEDQVEYASPFRLRELVRRHSEFVAHPVELTTAPKGEPHTERLNTSSALWRRSPGDVTEEQYHELYRHLSHDWEKPLLHRHFRVEGTNEFAGIVYVPRRSPVDLFHAEAKGGVRLHVRRVLVMEHCEELLPRWLRFVRGVIDSEDLPLNVSRETLQDSRVIRTMRKQLVKRVLDALDDLAKTDDYAGFLANFGAVLKEGLHFEPEHKDRLLALVRFATTHGAEPTSLAEYRARMKPEQDAIYYLVGASRTVLERAPHLEALRAKGFEVLLLTDPVDPFAIEGIGEFDGKKLVNAMDVESDPSPPEAQKEALEPLRQAVQKALEGVVASVRFTDRLTDSAACLALPPSGLPPHLERLLRAEGKLPEEKRTLELNPTHPLVEGLAAKLGAGMPEDALADTARLLFDLATVAEGSPLEDPSRLVAFVTRMAGEAIARG